MRRKATTEARGHLTAHGPLWHHRCWSGPRRAVSKQMAVPVENGSDPSAAVGDVPEARSPGADWILHITIETMTGKAGLAIGDVADPRASDPGVGPIPSTVCRSGS